MNQSPSRLYRFSSGGRAGVLLGMSLRQALPIVIGVLFLTVMLIVQLPLIGLLGPLAGCIVSFGRWHRAPLFEAAVPGVAMTWARWRKRSTWTRSSLTGSNSESIGDLPAALSGLELLDVADTFLAQQRSIGVVADRRAGSLSVVLAVRGSGFPVASLAEQDALVGVWGNALAPLARARCLVSRVTWQEWTHPVGMDGHRQFLQSVRADRAETTAGRDYERLLVEQSPFTIAHEVLLTITADLRRVRCPKRCWRRAGGRRRTDRRGAPTAARLETAGISVPGPLSPVEIAQAIRSPLGSHEGVGVAPGRVVTGSCHTPPRPPVGTDGRRPGLAPRPS